MKKEGSRKLVLNRETLAPLTDKEVEAVNGGASYSVSYSGYSISVGYSNGASVSVSTRSISASAGNASISISGG
jgi:hypothetical protein